MATKTTKEKNKDRPHFVYVIEELINSVWSVKYVGYTVHPKNRWVEHNKLGFSNKRLMTTAIVNNGAANFRMRVIEEVKDTKSALQMESALIAAFGTNAPNGYNSKGNGLERYLAMRKVIK